MATVDVKTQESCPVNVTVFTYTKDNKWVVEIPLFSIHAYAETPRAAKEEALRIFNKKNVEAVKRLSGPEREIGSKRKN